MDDYFNLLKKNIIIINNNNGTLTCDNENSKRKSSAVDLDYKRGDGRTAGL